jgi:polysaccharide pyruvyl transferase WcaK-like protein
MKYLHDIGFNTNGDCIYPDLVFSFPMLGKEIKLTDDVKPKTIGLGVIGYYGWLHDLDSGESIYQAYITKLKKFVHWLLEQGYVIRLLIGNLGVDQRPVDELLEFVRTDGQAGWRDRIISEKMEDVNELFQQIEQTDLVVASRFHNVLCALMMGRPVVSIGYHEKNDDLMAEMGLQDYCQHIEHFTPESLIQQFQSLSLDLVQASQCIQSKCAQYRQLLDQQYRQVLGDNFVRTRS